MREPTEEAGTRVSARAVVRWRRCTPAPAGRGVPELGILGYVGLAFGR